MKLCIIISFVCTLITLSGPLNVLAKDAISDVEDGLITEINADEINDYLDYLQRVDFDLDQGIALIKKEPLDIHNYKYLELIDRILSYSNKKTELITRQILRRTRMLAKLSLDLDFKSDQERSIAEGYARLILTAGVHWARDQYKSDKKFLESASSLSTKDIFKVHQVSRATFGLQWAEYVMLLSHQSPNNNVRLQTLMLLIPILKNDLALDPKFVRITTPIRQELISLNAAMPEDGKSLSSLDLLQTSAQIHSRLTTLLQVTNDFLVGVVGEIEEKRKEELLRLEREAQEEARRNKLKAIETARASKVPFTVNSIYIEPLGWHADLLGYVYFHRPFFEGKYFSADSDSDHVCSIMIKDSSISIVSSFIRKSRHHGDHNWKVHENGVVGYGPGAIIEFLGCRVDNKTLYTYDPESFSQLKAASYFFEDTRISPTIDNQFHVLMPMFQFDFVGSNSSGRYRGAYRIGIATGDDDEREAASLACRYFGFSNVVSFVISMDFRANNTYIYLKDSQGDVEVDRMSKSYDFDWYDNLPSKSYRHISELICRK